MASGRTYPRIGFIVTNLARPAGQVVVSYNQRCTAEQYIKEGKNAIKWTRQGADTHRRSLAPASLTRVLFTGARAIRLPFPAGASDHIPIHRKPGAQLPQHFDGRGPLPRL